MLHKYCNNPILIISEKFSEKPTVLTATATEQLFESPGYPDMVLGAHREGWIIKGPARTVITLRVSPMLLDHHRHFLRC